MADSVGFVGRRLFLVGIVLGCGTTLVVALDLAGFHWQGFSLLGLILTAVLILLMRDGKWLDPYPWSRGLDGEHQVSRVLHDLQEHGFHLVEHIDVGYGDVDHVVIGPTGVFAIETKNWSGQVTSAQGKLMKNNYPEEASVRQTMRNAIAIKERLGARWVEAILVCANAQVVGDPITIGNMLVVSRTRLTEVIRDRRVRLSETEASELVALLAAS